MKEEYQKLLDAIEWEGFHYALIDYSSWDEINDEKFHELRNNLIDANENLTEYINSKIDEYGLESYEF